MLALPKLLVVILALVAAWYLRRWLAQTARGLQQRRAAPPPARAIEDLVPCRACGAYVSAAGPSCGRAGCPQR